MIFDVLRSSVQAKDIFNENIPQNLKKDCEILRKIGGKGYRQLQGKEPKFKFRTLGSSRVVAGASRPTRLLYSRVESIAKVEGRCDNSFGEKSSCFARSPLCYKI